MSLAQQEYEITTDELRVVSVDMSGLLDNAELLSGSPSIQCSDNLAIADAQLNTSIVRICNRDTPIAKAVQFKVAASVSGEYEIEILVSTDAGQTVEGSIYLAVVATKH